MSKSLTQKERPHTFLFGCVRFSLRHTFFKHFNTVIHSFCTLYSSCCGNVVVNFQSEVWRSVTEIFLYCIYIVTAFKCGNGVIVSHIVEAFLRQSDFCDNFFEVLSNGSVCEIASKLIFENKIWERLIPKVTSDFSLLVLFFKASAKNIHDFIGNADVPTLIILYTSKLISGFVIFISFVLTFAYPRC